MLTKQISLTMPKTLYDEAMEEARLGGYRGVQEIALAFLRERLAQERRYRRIELKMRGKKTMTKEETLAYLRGL